MHLDELRQGLESAAHALPLLHAWGLRDRDQGWRNLRDLAAAVGVEAVRDLWPSLARLLPRCPDADMALNNLERFLANPAAAPHLHQLLEHRGRCLDTLLQLFSTSQF